jgi:hypothetical protein
MADQDLTPLLLDALGKRIEDPAAVGLAREIGKKPFKSATPNNNNASIVDRKLGLEVGTNLNIKNRSYWPYRKEGRVWVTWVSHAFLYPNYRGSLPAGLDWLMDEAALRARFKSSVQGVLRSRRFALPPPREGLKATVELGSNGRPGHLYVAVIQERDYATIDPGSRYEHNIELGLFAGWCAINGILREGRLEAERLDALRARQMTPLTFFSATLGGLLWQGDVEPEFDSFCYAYVRRLMQPEEATQLRDVQSIFGKDNYRRTAGEPITEDSWANYDRIAARYTQRLEQWRRGEINSMVDFPDEDTMPDGVR